MADTDQKREDEVLRRMLATKPKIHKAIGSITDKREPLKVKRIVRKPK